MAHIRALLSFVLLAIGIVPIHAACVERLQQDFIDDFLENPRRLLEHHPQGGSGLTWAVRTLSVVNPDTLKAVTRVVLFANLQQRNAIGNGLARAALACDARSPETSRRITDAVSKMADADVVRAYRQAFSFEQSHLPTADPDDNQNRRSGVGIEHGLGRKDMPLGNIYAPMGK